MSATPGPCHAGVVTRLLAAAVDLVVVVLLTALVYLSIAGVRFAWSPLAFTWPRPTTEVTVVVGGLIATTYLTVAWVTTGCTYGAGLLGVRVLARRGGRLGWARASVRALACVAFPVGLLWCAISPTRRSVQDLVVGSIVVYDPQPLSASAPDEIPAGSAHQGIPGGLRVVRGHDDSPERDERDRDQLQAGPGERDPDDRDRRRDGRGEVREREPPAGEDDPDDVADRGRRPGVLAAHELPAEGPQREVRDPERRQTERDRDDEEAAGQQTTPART